MNRVHDFMDIPQLFVVGEGENDMGATRKKTPERLDKIIQFIWNYQRTHNGDTPNASLVARNVGINEGGITYWLNLLIDAGRINKISSRPFRATITDTRENKSAIDRFQRILKMQERQEEEERDRIRASQAEYAEQTQRHEDKQALFAAAESPQPAERESVTVVPRSNVATLERPEPRDTADDVVATYTAARTQLSAARKDVRDAIPQLVKIAETRDLVYELVERGFVVSKR